MENSNKNNMYSSWTAYPEAKDLTLKSDILSNATSKTLKIKSNLMKKDRPTNMYLEQHIPHYNYL